MARHASARAAEGIQRFQLKLGGDPHEDAVRTRAVREAIGDGLLIVADANGGWRRHDAATAARLLENIVGVVLEQPCPTLEECLGVRQRTTLPMSLDEVIIDLAALTQAAALHAMEAINLKIGRVGGLTAARAMRDAAVALGVQMTIEDSWGGDVVTAAVSHLAASTPSEALLSVSFMNDWVTDHIAGHEPHSTRGVGMAPDRPGLGIEVDVERLGPPLATIGLS
jgi:L-alanine-DL-glutamate epimerase-like enolase superfamily enzyme